MDMFEFDKQRFIFATNALNLEAEEIQRDLSLPKDRAMHMARTIHPEFARMLQN